MPWPGAGKLQFEADATYFATKGFRVLVPDLRGHGSSKTPELFSEEEFELTAYASDIIALLDDLGIEAVKYVGNSLGGLIGLTILRDHPSRIEMLATFGTTYSLKMSELTIKVVSLANRLLKPRWIARMGANSISKDKQAQDTMYQLLVDVAPDVSTKTIADIGNYDLIDVALKGGKPILLLQGELDKSINDNLAPTLDALAPAPHFTKVDIAGAGHCANLDATELVREELLSFFNAT